MDLGELLSAGDVATFNQRKRAAGRVDLFAAELAGLTLHGVDLAGVNLDKADLTGTDLTEATLARAFLSDVDASEAILVGVLGVMLKMRDAVAEGIRLDDADLSKADLSGADLTASSAVRVKLVGARLKGVTAPNSTWTSADLTEAVVSDLQVVNSDLREVVLKAAAGNGADLSGCDLRGADLSEARLGRIKLVGADLRGAILVGADLSDADLTDAKLNAANLTRARLANANLSGADLTDAVLSDAALDGATVEGTTWSGADLGGVDAAGLGLDAATLGTLRRHGAAVDPDAEVAFTEVEVAVREGAVAVSWLNADGPERVSLRWAVAGVGMGVLPVSGPAVRGHAVLPWRDGFAICALVERGGVASVLRWTLGADGVLGPSTSLALPFEVASGPCWAADGDALVAVVLSRRGPSLVTLRDAGEGFAVAHAEQHAQAMRFAHAAPPVLACKAGVLMDVTGGRLGPPRRAPDGFEPGKGVVLPLGDRMYAAWATPKAGRDPGGLRGVWIGDRRPSDVDVLTQQPAMERLVGAVVGGRAHFAWVERHARAEVLSLLDLEAGEVARFTLPVFAVGLRLVDAGGRAAAAVSLAGGALLVVDSDGEEVAWIDPEGDLDG